MCLVRVVSVTTLLVVLVIVKGDDFPSLIQANATIAVILDHQYLDEKYETTLKVVQNFFENIKKENMKNGGLNIQYFSWTSVNLKREFTAVLSVASCKDTWTIFKTADTENLLVLALTDPDCPRLPGSKAVTIPLLSKGQELSQLLLDLRTSGAIKWKSATVIHDDTLGRDMISRVVMSLSSKVPDTSTQIMAVSLFSLPTEKQDWMQRKTIIKLLKNLPLAHLGSMFIVIVTSEILGNILEISSSLGLVNPRSQWLYVIPDTDAKNDNTSMYSTMLGEGYNVAFLNNITSGDPGCVFGIECHAKEYIRGFASALDLCIKEEQTMYQQVSDEEWETIRPTKTQRRDKLLELTKIYLQKHSACGNCSMWRIRSGETWGFSYQQNKTETLQPLLQVGYWRPSDGAQLTDSIFPHIANGFRGKSLPLVSFHNPPWTILTQNESGAVTSYKGVVFDIINQLAINLNFSFTVTFPLTKNGTKKLNKENETSDLLRQAPTYKIPESILEMVEKKQVILAAAAFTISENNKKTVNFTNPISIQTYTFLVSRPRELSRALLFMSPFTYDTWLCLACAIALMGPILCLIHNLSPYCEYYGISKKGGLSSLHNCLWYMYGALLQQGGMYLPEADSGRLVVGTWWLVVLVVVTTYCGNLVAFLTFPKIDIPITTIEQLLSYEGTVTWAVRKGTFLEDYLKSSDQPKYKKLYAGAKFVVSEDSAMIERVRKGKHVYIEWKTNLQFIMKRGFQETDTCDFALGSDDFLNEQIGIIIEQNSPYLPIVNEEIKRMLQVGLIQKWLSEYLPKKDRCWNVGKVVEVNNHTVNIDDMQGSFFVLFLGFLLAIIIIVMECGWFKRRKFKDRVLIKPYVD